MITEAQWNEAMARVGAEVADHNAANPDARYSAHYVRWMRLAAGLKLAMETAKIEIPALHASWQERSEDAGRMSFCMEATHAVSIFYAGRELLTLEGLGAAMLLKARETVKTIRRARGGRDYEGELLRRPLDEVNQAAARARPEWAAGEAAIEVQKRYRTDFPGKRLGTKHYAAYVAAQTPAAVAQVVGAKKQALAAVLAYSRKKVAQAGGLLEAAAGRCQGAAELRREAAWLDALGVGGPGVDAEDVAEIIREAADHREHAAASMIAEMERVFGAAEKLLAEPPA